MPTIIVNNICCIYILYYIFISYYIIILYKSNAYAHSASEMNPQPHKWI